MLKKATIYFFLLIQIACHQQNPLSEPNPPESPQNTQEEENFTLLEIDLDKASKTGSLPGTQIIEVSNDVVFKRDKKYEAIPLKPYLRKLIAENNLDTTNTEIVFLCKDGYNPTMPLSLVLSQQPYLAIRDLEAAEGKNWLDTLQGKWSPFYLVWDHLEKDAKGFTWPYGLKYLHFTASDKVFKDAIPEDEAHMAGFDLYREKCMKCHSVNMVGGIMGPEFNIPKNITEYWKKSDIFAFVKNPYSYRYNSKMPPVAGITDAELESIYTYLEYMGTQKIELE